jgi:quercetin dioxygenase-like cupin family protein
MRLRTAALSALIAIGWSGAALAQTQPAQPATARTVIAATKLPSVVDKPLDFRAVNISLAPGGSETIATADGIFYQLSGSAEVAADGVTTTIGTGNGLYVAAGKSAKVTAKGTEPSTTLHFTLAPAGVAGPATANVKEVYRTTKPIAGLKPGRHDLNMTRVTFPAGMPSNAPHHRTGAALYYVISGSGVQTVEGQPEVKPSGTFILEPGGLVHQWGNPGAIPLTFITFNINLEGTTPTAPGRPAPTQ